MNKLETVPLHVAATRPTLLKGVPLPLAVIIGMIAMIAGILVPWGPVILFPLWTAASYLVRRDYHAPAILLLRLKVSGLALEAATWGGASKDAFPAKSTGRFRGIPHG